MPSLENWGRWVKDLLWLANSPHTSNVTDSYVNSTHLQVVTISSLGDLQSYGSTNAQWGMSGMEFIKGEVGLLLYGTE